MSGRSPPPSTCGFGRADVIGTYIVKDRVREGTTDEMIDAAYLAWAADVGDGRSSILVAEASGDGERA